MNRVCLLAFCLLTAGVSHAQSKTRAPLHFDLAKIGMVIDGQQQCNDTNNRLQDLPSREMDRIEAAGPRSVPVLIGMITDARMAKTKEPIICYWPGMAIGDIAFCLLDGLFTDKNGTPAVRGSTWHDMLQPDDKLPAWEQIRKRGRATLQARWQKLWGKYEGQIYWDAQDRCFKLKAQ